MTLSPTPISLIESYFDRKLERSSLRLFDEVKDDTWIAFARFYRAQMTEGFASRFLDPSEETANKIRLYFEPQLWRHWDHAVEQRYGLTPLLGGRGHPPETRPDQQQVSQMLDPLKKHLLFAHSLFIRDNFYYCFDAVADSVDPAAWRSDPNVSDLVARSVVSIKRWLPILIELRNFIEAGILVFMPYYITPSFPWGGMAPNLRKDYEQLRIKADPKRKPRTPPVFDLGSWNEPPQIKVVAPPPVSVAADDVIAAWLNGRLLGLDIVFPDRDAFDLGSRLYFAQSGISDITTDLMSIEGLPFGDNTGLGLEDLWKIRKNEGDFQEVRTIVADCKRQLEADLPAGASRRAVNAMCRSYIGDRLSALGGEKTLRFLEKPVVGVATSIAVGIGVAIVTANPVVGVGAGAVFSTGFVRLVENPTSHKRRAIAKLQALL
jgi:hypothetical protein